LTGAWRELEGPASWLLAAVYTRRPISIAREHSGVQVVMNRVFRISAAVVLAALAVLVGAEQGHVASRHVVADTTWSVPADTTTTTTVADGGKAQPADTTW
jgi:hypothetical protein